MYINRGITLGSGLWSQDNPKPAFSFKSNNTSSVDLAAGADRTFSAVNIGTPHAKRLVILNIHAYGLSAAQITVTVGGIEASKLAPDVGGFAWIYTALVPSGETADIVIHNGSGSNSVRQAAAVFVGYPDDPTPVDAVGVSATTTNNAVISSLEVRAGGFVVWNYEQYNTTGNVDVTWNGVDAVVESYDSPIESITTWAGGYLLTTVDTTDDDLTASETTSGFKGLLAATWGP